MLSQPPLTLLRQELRRRRLQGFLVPRADEHQGEYVPPSAERLAWLTGFTGSAGFAIVLEDQAVLFVDGRYTLQAAAEVDRSLFQFRHLHDDPPNRWLAKTLPAGTRVGYDPWLHTPDVVELMVQACRAAKAKLVPVRSNPLDAVWRDRPAPPTAPLVLHPLEFAGRDAAEKRAEIAEMLTRDKVDTAVLTKPESIAWLLNIRGGDVPFAPMPLAFALIHADQTVDLFVDPKKLSAPVVDHLGPAVRLAPPDMFGAALDGLAERTVRIDTATAPAWAQDRLVAARVTLDKGIDPCEVPKACKNAVELAGSRRAHQRDGIALARFFAWLDGAIDAGDVTEITAAETLAEFRRAGAHFRSQSFPTISGAGPNGAIVHYRSTAATNRKLAAGQLYLVDSGAQYLDATTDVTRTIAVGAVGAEERRRFTLVLKGHIALATARFPEGTTGSQLDALARRALWNEGLDYDHGTGHGVGSYLGVHEGPQRIGKQSSGQPLLPGMVISDEPGYYKAGAYGIRIENLVAVKRWEAVSERPMLEFEVLTLAPIDLALVDTALLDAQEIAWLNAYHARVREALTPDLDAATAAWLERATREI